MSTHIRELEPRALWNHFADFNAVPRASKAEGKAISFMLDFGRGLGLETFRDETGNVMIRKAATAGFEGRKSVVLQAHLDMVHQKNSDTAFDFETEGIAMEVSGGWVRASGTTLGADNGVGVAAIMALLRADDIPHPALEALFTVDEETGMTGARDLEPDMLKGDLLLNLDTEEDDEIDIGCAGGVDIIAAGKYAEVSPAGMAAVEIRIKGLRGGHSGIDIISVTANANKLMNSLLRRCCEFLSARVSSIEGGGLRNAIPRESRALIVIPRKSQQLLEPFFTGLQAEFKERYASSEPGFEISWKSVEGNPGVMEEDAQNSLLEAVEQAHNGVYAMSTEVAGQVETSNNIARVRVADSKWMVECLTRSSSEHAKYELATALKRDFERVGAHVEFSGDYPGWTPDPGSKLLRVAEAQYRSLFGASPRLVSCHAGLECGIIKRTYPALDIISFGPTIRGAHSPDECVNILSVQKFWKFLTTLLQHIPEA